jgi:hypothetical protein
MRAMTDQPSVPFFAMPGFAMPSFTALGIAPMQALAGMPAALMATIQDINRHWLGHMQSHASLTTNLASRLTAAHSMPDAIGAWQDWATRHMELAGEEMRCFYADAQGLASSCVPTPEERFKA